MLTPVMDSYGLGIENFRGDIGYHGGWNEGFLTTWIFSLREELCAAVMFNRTTDELDREQSKIAIELFRTMEEDAADAPGKRSLKTFCGKYEHPENADVCVDEVFLEDGELYARFFGAENGELTARLYPIGKKTFGRKGGLVKIVFGKDCLSVDDEPACKKL